MKGLRKAGQALVGLGWLILGWAAVEHRINLGRARANHFPGDLHPGDLTARPW